MGRKTILIAFVLLGTLSSIRAQAWCQLAPASSSDQRSGAIISRALNAVPATISVPKDVPSGTELYRMTARNNSYGYYRVNCNNYISNSNNYYVMGQFVGDVTPLPSSWQGSSLGTVYQTGTEGVGVVILTSTLNRAPGVKIYGSQSCSDVVSRGCSLSAQGSDITFVLIKTGEITASSIDLTSLPLLESVVGGSNSPGSDITVFRPTFVGLITFTQPTCTLAEVSKTVNLGEHRASDFTAANSATPWVKASIELINCNYGGKQNYRYNILQSEWKKTGVTTVAPPITTDATWNLSLTPATTVIDDTNGIMAISSEADSATGIGIQLSSSDTVLTPMKFSQPTTGIMVSGVNAMMTIPLYARYIKTGSTVTAGKANGKLTYVVEYK